MAKLSKLAASQSPGAMAADWSSLPFDLIRRIGKRFLDTDDLDHYMNFRAVCSNWRLATADPKVNTMNFLPSKWIMLEHSIFVDCSLTLVNVSTGRFLRKTISMLLNYFFVGATRGGLLVLGERDPPYETRVLNPFTGTIFNFRVPIVAEEITGVVVTSSPMMVFISSRHNLSFMWADQSSESFEEFKADYPNHLMNMTPFAGDVHVTNHGSIISTVDVGTQDDDPKRRSITMSTSIVGPNTLLDASNEHYLVESGGELLLVSGPSCPGQVVVYKVDTMNKALAPVRSIGSRAIFVSSYRCLSVDATKFYTVQAGSIYYVEHALFRDAKSVGDGWGEPMSDPSLLCLYDCFDTQTLMEVFAAYCRSKFSELEIILYGGDDYFSDGNGEPDGSSE